MPPPLGPSSAVRPPAGTESDTSSSAANEPKRLPTPATSMPIATSFRCWNRGMRARTPSAMSASTTAAEYAATESNCPDAILDEEGQRLRLALDPPAHDDTAPYSPIARAVVSTMP